MANIVTLGETLALASAGVLAVNGKTLLDLRHGGGLVGTVDVRILRQPVSIGIQGRKLHQVRRTLTAPAPWTMSWPASTALSEAPDPSRGMIFDFW